MKREQKHLDVVANRLLCFLSRQHCEAGLFLSHPVFTHNFPHARGAGVQNGKGLEGHMPARARSLLQEHVHAFLGDHRGCWLPAAGGCESGGQGEAAVQTRIPFEPPLCGCRNVTSLDAWMKITRSPVHILFVTKFG